MNATRTIGPWLAVLINVNVIIGSGIFINLYPLISGGGTGSFVAYLIAALFLLPVVAVLAALASNQPESGGLYVYTRTYLHPFIGFLCGWGYFLGKSISAGMMTNTMVSICERVFPSLHAIPHLLLVALFLLFLAGSNIIGASLKGRIQKLFIIAKITPLVFVVGLLAWYGGTVPLSFETLSVGSLSSLVPTAMFAMIGFEITCTIAHFFERPRYTIPRAFIFGFLIVVAILSLFQFSVSALLPFHYLHSIPGYPSAPLNSLVSLYLPSMSSFSWILTACVYLSILGGAFGVLTSNCWNLHRLAAEGHVPGARFLTKLTKGQVPWVSLLIEVVVCLLSISITTEQVPLQKMSILSVIFSFFCAMLAAVFARNGHGKRLIHPLIILVALCSTVLLLGITLHQVYLHGISFSYISLFGAGIACAAYYAIKEFLHRRYSTY